MIKFKYNSAIQYFEISPEFLQEGLSASKDKYIKIRLRPLNEDNLKNKKNIDIEIIEKCTWIEELIVDQSVKIEKGDFCRLQNLCNLKVLSTLAYDLIDFSCFKQLRELVLIGGSNLDGLDELTKLESIYLIKWQAENLPENIKNISCNPLAIRISASKKLKFIDALADIKYLGKLTLQDLPNVVLDGKLNLCENLVDLHIENIGSGDLSNLKINSLRKLFASKINSLKFIENLKNLENLRFWDCIDGDINPVVNHQNLKTINFTPEKKNYTHKLKVLENMLASKMGSLQGR